MSQRKLSTVDSKLGGIAAIKQLAKERGVHLLALEDDKGNQLIAASVKQFTVICYKLFQNLPHGRHKGAGAFNAME